jgi:hypothetical protein
MSSFNLSSLKEITQYQSGGYELSPFLTQQGPNNSSTGMIFGTNGVQILPPIPYECCERSKDKDNKNVSVYKLRTNPINEDSPTYDMKALTFSSGTVEEFIMWKRDLLKICVSQHVTDAAGNFTTKLSLVSTYTLNDQLVMTWSTQDDHLNSRYLKIIFQ